VARPRTVSDATLLDATARTIGEVGLPGLTLARVGASCGLSAAAVVQRFGSKRALLLALARRGADHRLPPAGASPCATLVEALVARAGAVATPAALAHHLGFLQTDLGDPEFGALARRQAQATREDLERLLAGAAEAGELAGATDTAALAEVVEATYHGALIAWALRGEGELAPWLRRRLEAALAPHRIPTAALGFAP
jgi:AcrR family transcriptional regulator